MSELSDEIERKFVDSIDIDDLEVWTEDGWKEVSSIHKTVPYTRWIVETSGGKRLECADDHIVITNDERQIFVKDCVIGETMLHTIDGPELVTRLETTNIEENMYDVTVESDSHTFFSNGILSHNTTTAATIILHYILFNEMKLVGLLANKGDAAREILERVKLSFENLPDWLQQGVVEWNKGSVKLENGSKVIAAATSSSAIRGRSCSFLYIDESAFIENWDDFFASVFPTISSGKETKILFTSTPNGLNHFYKICDGAKKTGKDHNGYSIVEVTYDKVPGRDEEWRQETLAAMNWDEDRFAQEFSCAFLGSSGTLISGRSLKSLVYQRPIVTSSGGEINQYERPAKDRTYVVIADVSRGKGLDYSAAQIIDVTEMPYRQVCTYRSNVVTPVEYAKELFTLGKMYNTASIMVEINDIGGQVVDILHYDFEYDAILMTENAGSKGKRIGTGFGKNSERGIRTTKTVKNVGCSILKLLIEQNQLIINDYQTIYELSRFSKKGHSYEAESGCNDDLVMGLVLFAWLSDQQFFKELTDINTIMKLRDRSDEDIENDLVPFGFIDHCEGDLSEEPDVIDLTAPGDLPEAYKRLLNSF